MLPTAVLATSVRNSGARTADTSWCNTTIRQSRFVRPRNPLTFAVSKGRLSAHHWVRFPSQKRITGHIALIGRAPASTTVSTQREAAGSSPAVSASRLHAQSHDLITRVKSYVSEKTWVFRHSARVSLTSQLCFVVQWRTTKQSRCIPLHREDQCFQHRMVRVCQVGRQGIRSPPSRGFDSRHIH